MPEINFDSKEDLLNFKIGLMASQEMYYKEKIEELKTDRVKAESNLKLQLHKMNIIAIALIVTILAIIMCITFIICNTELKIDTTSSSSSSNSETYGDMTLSGDDIKFKTNDISIGDGNNFSVPDD